MGSIVENISEVRRRIAEAEARSCRPPGSVTLVAVTKTVGVEAAREALAAGVNHLGESRVQEARNKHSAIGDEAVWHMIGPLQTNKAKYCPGLFSLIHSLDRMELIEELSRRGEKSGKIVEGLLEINVSGERQKSGCAPENAKEILLAASKLSWIKIKGIMTVPPYSDNPEDSRPYFKKLAALKRELEELGLKNASMDIISAGMSGDYEVAIEEGSTLVRVGTAIFGEREEK